MTNIAAGPSPSCVVRSPTAATPESLVIAIESRADFRPIRVGARFGDRFLTAQPYETLVRVDCEGRVYPGLASSWSAAPGGARLLFHLRAGARFWGGDPVRAGDVLAAWNAAVARSMVARELLRRAVVVDDSTLGVDISADSVAMLAEPALAVRRPRSIGSSDSEEGTGGYVMGPLIADAPTVRLTPVHPGALPRLVVRLDSRNARDRIDAGDDIIITDDPAAIAYARARPELVVVPLPWDRLYVLASPRHVDGAGSPSSSAAAAGRAALARDAMRGDARAAESPWWFAAAESCPGASPSAPTAAPSTGGRIVFHSMDTGARAIAERLAALAEIGGGNADAGLGALAPELLANGKRVTAVGLMAGGFDATLRQGDDLAYVIDVPAHSLTPCADLAALREAIPWLGADARALVPLVEARDHAILRRDRVSIVIDWNGAVRVIGASSDSTVRR